MPEEKKNCFVITPIGGDGSAIRRHIDGIIQAAIVPVLEPEYKVVVAHKISEPGSITKQVIKHIYSDALVITNLTEKNPNVMYELAFRHSLGKPVIMIAEKGTNLPSDIIMERTIFYQNDASGVLELREELEKALKEIDYEKKSSPIYNVLREFNIEAKIVELPEESSLAQGDVMKYIIYRLDRIEKNMRVREKPDHKIIFKYQILPSVSSDLEIRDEIQGRLLDEEGYFIVNYKGIAIDDAQKTITFLLNYSKLDKVTQCVPLLVKALKEAGFIGVKLERVE